MARPRGVALLHGGELRVDDDLGIGDLLTEAADLQKASRALTEPVQPTVDTSIRPVSLYDPEVATTPQLGPEDYRPGSNPVFYASAVGTLGLRSEVMQ